MSGVHTQLLKDNENDDTDYQGVAECSECGGDIDKNRNSVAICEHSSEDCRFCGYETCDGNC